MEPSESHGRYCIPCADLVEGIQPVVRNWTRPICIARHAYGDVYKNTNAHRQSGKAELVYGRGRYRNQSLFIPLKARCANGMHNVDKSIESFARACFNYVDQK